jgi:hypothetical protein
MTSDNAQRASDHAARAEELLSQLAGHKFGRKPGLEHGAASSEASAHATLAVFYDARARELDA